MIKTRLAGLLLTFATLSFAFPGAAQIAVPNGLKTRLSQTDQNVRAEIIVPGILGLFQRHARSVKYGNDKCGPLIAGFQLQKMVAKDNQIETFASFTAKQVECRTVIDETIVNNKIQVIKKVIPVEVNRITNEPVGSVISISSGAGFDFSLRSALSDLVPRQGKMDLRRIVSSYNSQISAAYTRLLDQVLRQAKTKLMAEQSAAGQAFSEAVKKGSSFKIDARMKGQDLLLTLTEDRALQQLASGCRKIDGVAYQIVAQGLLAGAEFCDIKRGSDLKNPELIVIHYSATNSLSGTIKFLQQPKASGSYHILIGRNGEVVQLLPLTKRASHSARGRWKGRGRVNDFSIAISLINAGRLKKGDSGWEQFSGRGVPKDEVVILAHRLTPKNPEGWHKYTPAQIKALTSVVKALMARFSIPPDAVLGNDDIDPVRKVDPGPAFNWNAFRRQLR